MARAPVLDPRHTPLVHSLSAGIFEEISGRERFLTISPDDIFEAATTFVRYRLPTLDVIRHTALGARRMFLSDLRHLDRRSFPDMQLIMQLLEHFKPQLLKSKANAKDPLFEEVVIPDRLKNFRADFSLLGAFLKPNQLMANFVSRELARGKCQTPPYFPYIAPDISIDPWPVPSAEHTTAVAKWKANKQASKPGAQFLPFPAWTLYRLRFISAADICGPSVA